MTNKEKKSAYNKELVDFTEYVFSKACEIARKYGENPTLAARTCGASISLVALCHKIENGEEKSDKEIVSKYESKFVTSVNTTEDVTNDIQKQKEERINVNRAKIEAIKNASILGIRVKGEDEGNDTMYLVKFHAVVDEEYGRINVYDVTNKIYRDVYANDVEVIA